MHINDPQQHITMLEAISLMEVAYQSFSDGSAVVPQRYVSDLEGSGLTFLCKPAYLNKEKRLGVKMLTQRMAHRPDLEKAGVPTIQGWMMLIDGETGSLMATMDGGWITALRTGAASGLATQLLSREDATVLALYGCGVQGATQLEAVSCVRNLERVLLFDLNRDRLETFRHQQQGRYDFELVAASHNGELKSADIICTATNATEPLFGMNDLKPGVHINAVGSFKPHMQEIDPEIVASAKVYTDSSEACLEESGDLIRPILKGIMTADQIQGELGEFLMGKIDGRSDPECNTLFKSVGIAIQDLVVANAIYQNTHSQNQ